MSAPTEGGRRVIAFRSTIAGVPMKRELYDYLSQCVAKAANMYPDEVSATLSNIIDRSFSYLAHHDTDEFVPYGNYWSFSTFVKQVWMDHRYGLRSRPQIVVLYGPPGTGKTTWVRNAARYYLVTIFLEGIYLEVTPGDFSSKYAGIPVAILKSVVDTVSTTKFPSVLLLDEADGFLMKPREASGGVEIEQQKLVAELKASISALLSTNCPLVIVMTTNYKDAIVNADPAIGDRVTAWIEVPHPPLSARLTMVRKLLPPVFRDMWGSVHPYSQAEAFRALRARAELPVPDLRRTSHPKFRFRMPWVAPVLTFEADYLIGYLLAWGWNPLDEDVLPSLQLDFHTAATLWEDSNPLFAVYARGLLTQLEMLRKHNEVTHGVGKSFLRSFYLLKGGVDVFGKLLVMAYSRFWDKVDLTVKERELGERLPEELDLLSRLLAESTMVHGVPPSLLHHSVSKLSASSAFALMVNNVLCTAGLAANALRQLYLPFLASYYEDPLMRFIDLRQRLGDYNRFVTEELVGGELLEPLRVLLTVGDPDKAWEEARRILLSLDDDLRPFVGIVAIVARLGHRAIHEGDVEKKGATLYELYRDAGAVIRAVVASAEELGIKEYVPVMFDPSTFPPGGVSVYENGDWMVFDPTLFNFRAACVCDSAHVYSVASIVEKNIGHYTWKVVSMSAGEEASVVKKANHVSG